MLQEITIQDKLPSVVKKYNMLEESISSAYNLYNEINSYVTEEIGTIINFVDEQTQAVVTYALLEDIGADSNDNTPMYKIEKALRGETS